MPIGSTNVYYPGDLILSTVSSSGTSFIETKIVASTSSIIYFDNNARINSASLSSFTFGSSSYSLTSSYSVYAETASNAQNAQDILVYVKNTSGAIITKGSLVRIKDVENSGFNPTIELASFTNESGSANTLGYAYQQFAINDLGYVITEGKLTGVNTGNFSPGDLLYLSSSGQYTNVKPIPPNHGVRVGQVIRAHPTVGSIYVTIDNGAELDELHNVIDNSTTSSYGDLLTKSGSVWINSKNLTGSYTLSGSLTTNGAISALNVTASLLGTASWANNSISSSYSLTSSYINLSSSNVFVQGGNSFGTTALLGTNDAQSLALETNGTTRMSINSNGNVAINTSTSGFYRLNIADTHQGSLGSASLYIETIQNQNQGLATSANDSGIQNVYFVNNFTSSTAIQNQAIFNQLYINGSGSFSGSYRASRNAITISNTASLDSGGNITNTYLTNQISPNIPTFSIPNWIAGTGTFIDIITGNSTGSINNLYNHQIGSPFPSGGAGGITVTNSYGVYINKQKTTNIVTNGWGIYQADTGDLNIFAGKTRIGSTTTPVNTLDVTGNISASVVTASLFFGTSSFATTAQTANALNTANSYTIAGLTNNGTLSQQGTLSMGAGYQLLITTGNAAAPGLSFVGDTNTGIYSPVSDTIGFSISGSERVRIDNNGNIGIGTTSPTVLLDVSGSSRFGFTSINTHQFTGSVNINGQLTSSNARINGTLTSTRLAEKIVTFTPQSGSFTGAPAWYRIISGSGVADYGRVRMSANFDNSRSDLEFVYGVRNYDTDGAGAFINITRASTYNSIFNAVRVIETGNLAEPYAIDVLIGNYLNIQAPGTITCLYESQFIGAVLDTPFFVSASATGSNVVKTVDNTYTSGYPRIGPTYSDGLAVATSQGQLTVGYRGNYAYNNPNYLNYALLVSGSVGINTASPSQKLHVVGDALIASTSTAGNLYFGGTDLYVRRDNNYDLSLVQNGDSNSALYLASAGNVYLNIDSNNNDTTKAFIVQNDALKSGTELFRVQENGSVGIGTSSPNNKLDVVGGTGTTIGLSNSDDANRGGKLSIISGSATGRQFYVGTTSAIYNLVFGIDSVEKARIDTSGNVGIGTTSPSSKLSVSGSIESLTGDGGEGGQLVLRGNTYRYNVDNFNGQALRLFREDDATSANGVVLMYISGSGNVGINTTNPAYLLDVNGSSRHGSITSNTHLFTGSVSVSNNVTCLSLTETSTEAVKYNIVPLPSQLENVLKLTPVSFNYKTNNKHSIGLIAEEVAKVYPEFTSENNDSISYGKITSVLIQSIKELKSIIDTQQKQIEELSNKFKQL